MARTTDVDGAEPLGRASSPQRPQTTTPPAARPAGPAKAAPPDHELDRLLERARRGDAEAWKGLVDRLRRLVYSIPHKYRLDEEGAADVFVTTFGALYRNLDRIESGLALPSWVATTAARECLRLRRIAGRTVEMPLEELVATEERDAAEEAVAADESFRVGRALDGMQPRCRELLRALYDEDEPAYVEIAGRLGMPVGAIGPTRARCLDKLRRTLEAEGFSA